MLQALMVVGAVWLGACLVFMMPLVALCRASARGDRQLVASARPDRATERTLVALRISTANTRTAIARGPTRSPRGSGSPSAV